MKAETTIFQGVTYYRYPQSPRWADRHYFKRQGRCLHRVIWEYHHGPIPEGYEVHHKDGDTDNNTLNNLELVSKEKHRALYHPHITPDRIAFFNRFARPKAAKWHQSSEGRIWHQEHAKRLYEKREPVGRICEYCGESYLVKWNRSLDRFCSGRCRAAVRYASGVDNVIRACAWCGESFTINKYQKGRYCSRPCRGHARQKKQVAR